MIRTLLLVLIVTGCAGQPERIVYHDTYEATTEAYGDRYHFKGRTIGGFIHWVNGVCEIHVSREAPDLQRCIEHERDHCWFGDWHPDEFIRDC